MRLMIHGLCSVALILSLSAGCKKDQPAANAAKPADKGKAAKPKADEAKEEAKEEAKVEAKDEAKPAPVPEAPKVEDTIPIKEIDVASLSTCALLETGTVRCWGGNTEGQLGQGKDKAELLESYDPLDVGGLSDVEKLWTMDSYCWSGSYSDGSVDTTCVRKKDGTVLCWGHNSLIYGDGEYKGWTTPKPIDALKGALDLDAHCGTACAVMADKTVTCWGSGAFGKIGDGAKAERKVPTAVTGLTDAAEVGCGQNHCCARKNDGTVWCWGYNSSGQCGDGTSEERHTPVQVADLTGAKELAVYNNGGCALRGDGNVQCWGEYAEHKKTSLIEGATDIVALDGEGPVCGQRKDGTVVCWGSNRYGELGDGTNTERKKKAAAVKDLKDVAMVRVGTHHACALLSDKKSVQCWGENGRGQLGDVSIADSNVPVGAKQIAAKDLKPTDAAAIPTAMPATPPVPDLAGKPDACGADAELTVKAYGKDMTMKVGKLWAKLDWDKKGRDLIIANFDRDPKSYEMGRGQQLMVTVGLSHWMEEEYEDNGEKKKKLVKGELEVGKDYKPGFTELFRASASLRDRGTEHHTSAGAIKLVHSDASWVCGEIDMSDKDGKTAIKGKFAAKILAAE